MLSLRYLIKIRSCLGFRLKMGHLHGYILMRMLRSIRLVLRIFIVSSLILIFLLLLSSRNNRIICRKISLRVRMRMNLRFRVSCVYQYSLLNVWGYARNLVRLQPQIEIISNTSKVKTYTKSN